MRVRTPRPRPRTLSSERFLMALSRARFTLVPLLLALAFALAFAATPARAHCDTLDGPVVTDARAALAAGDPTAVLKWVKPADEGEIRAAFARALAVRTGGGEAAALADTWFFETLVRVHRAGEGAGFTGLKPAGAVEPPIAMADRALASGSVDELATRIGEHASAAVTARFRRVVEARAHAGESVAQGRQYVAAYVDYVHFVEGVVAAVHREAGHAEAEAAAHAH